LALFLIKHIGHSISVNNPIEFILNNLSSNLKDMKEIAIAVISNYYSLPFYPNFTDEKLTNLTEIHSKTIDNIMNQMEYLIEDSPPIPDMIWNKYKGELKNVINPS
jgi:hypothetical protein